MLTPEDVRRKDEFLDRCFDEHALPSFSDETDTGLYRVVFKIGYALAMRDVAEDKLNNLVGIDLLGT